MNNPRLLYLVQHTNKEMFKIGIGTSNQRFHDLDRDYSIDWNESFYFKGENDDVVKMEKILHKLFYSHRLDKQKGTGGTEWFSSRCLNSVVEAIVFNTNNSNYAIELEHNEIILNVASYEKLIVEKFEQTSIPWSETKHSIFVKYPQNIIDKWIELDNLNPTPKIISEMNRLIPEFKCLLKPLELMNVMFSENVGEYENSKNEPLAYLPAIQIDLVNALIYLIWEQINTNSTKYSENTDSIKSFDIELKSVTDMLGKYQKDYSPIIQLLTDLQKYVVKINMLDKDSSVINKSSIVLIPKISWSEESGQIRKTVKIWFDSEILNFFVKKNKVFAKLYLKIQFSFVSKYSKLLYEILKDYEKVGNTITFDNLILLLNVKTEGTKNSEWSSFRPHILEKAIDEINEKADIKVSYEPIKERPSENDRLQVTKVKFYVEKQPNPRLVELGLIQQPIENNKYYNKSKTKLDKLVKNGYKVIDEEKWIESDIKKNTERYDAEIRIDSWLSNTDEQTKNEFFEELTKNIHGCDDPMVVIDDYKVVGLFSKDTFTKNPQETIELLNGVIQQISD